MALECEDKILSTTETLLNDKRAAYAKSICLIHTKSLVIICLFWLVVIYVSCYFYYTKYRSEQQHLLTFQNTSIRLDIKNIL